MIIEKFKIEVFKKGDIENDGDWSGPVDEFVVRLPHSCDEWVISENQDKNVVIEDLELFIKELQQALVYLKS